MDNRIITGVVSIFTAIVILAAVMVPVIQDAGYTTTTQTTSITNEGAAAIKLSKMTTGFSLDMTVENDGSDLTITNGTDTITAALDPMFILSTDSAAIYVNDDYDVIAVWTSGGTTQQYTLTGDFSVEITENYLVIDDGSDHNLPLPSEYMFVPSSTGIYGSFTAGDLNKIPGDPVIAAGYYAGVAAYNANNTLGDALTEVVVSDDETITSVSWEIPSADPDQFNPDQIDFDPGQIQIQPIDIDPIDINPIDPGDNIIMSVPTPTYTDGDWGYELNGIQARLVSYSGTGGGDIIIPATVGGYSVTQLGKGGSSDNIFDTSITCTSLTIPEGVTSILNGAFRNCSGLGGTLTLPSTLTSIGTYAFRGCTGFTGALVLPNSLTNIDNYAFRGCTGFTSLVLPNSITTIKDAVFDGCTGLTGTLVLPNSLTTINQLAFNGCTHITEIQWPNSLTTIGLSAFNGCTGLTGTLVLPVTLTSIGDTVFSNCSNIDGLIVYTDATPSTNTFSNTPNIKDVLNFSNNDTWTSSSYGLNAESVQDHIDALIYLAPDNYTETEVIKTPNDYATLYNVIPLIVLGSLLLAAAGIMLLRRE